MPRDPHRDQPIFVWGAPLSDASAALVLVHGRGAGVDDMRALAGELDHPGLTYIAPAAAGRTWYPYSFLEPLARNEPHLSSALRVLNRALQKAEAAKVPTQRVALLGFSQGACLALEYAARNARRYGGLIGLSGGLIGPEGTPRDYAGTLDGTPVFLGCSDVDPHIPKRRVDETADVFGRLGGHVVKRIYPGMGHTVNADEIASARAILQTMVGSR
ncbi:MAG TPA: dienelactone hydrolase family protein [Gemmatimonadales bacterium]|nr:dienelactone hydrolase family protein [Gemmatimonadales bacterium]